MLFVNGTIINEEVEAQEVIKRGSGHVVGSRRNIREYVEQSTNAKDVMILALNEVLGTVPTKETIDVSKEVLASIKRGMENNSLRRRVGYGQKEKEVKQVMNIKGYDRNGLAILK